MAYLKLLFFKKRLRVNTIANTLLILITLLGGTLRYHNISKQSFWFDEAFSYYASAGNINNIFIETNMLLFYLIAHCWMLIVRDTTEGNLRSLTAIFSILSIPAIYVLANNLFPNKKNINGILAAILLSINAYSIQYAQEFRSYSLVQLLLIISTLVLINAVKKTIHSSKIYNNWWLIYIFTSLAAIYTHFFAILIVISQGLSFLVFVKNNIRISPLKHITLSFLFICLMSLPLFANTFTNNWKYHITWIPETKLSHILDFVINITGRQGNELAYLYIFLISTAILFLLRTWNKNNLFANWKKVLTINCFLLPIIFTIIFSKLYLPIFIGKYLLIVLPYMIIIAAKGTTVIADLAIQAKLFTKQSWILLSFTVYALVVFYSTMGIQMFHKYEIKDNWRETSQFLKKNCLSSQTLRLYHPYYAEYTATYYNPALKNGLDLPDATSEAKRNLVIMDSLKSKNYTQICITSQQNIWNENILKTFNINNYYLASQKNIGNIVIGIYLNNLP